MTAKRLIITVIVVVMVIGAIVIANISAKRQQDAVSALGSPSTVVKSDPSVGGSEETPQPEEPRTTNGPAAPTVSVPVPSDSPLPASNLTKDRYAEGANDTDANNAAEFRSIWEPTVVGFATAFGKASTPNWLDSVKPYVTSALFAKMQTIDQSNLNELQYVKYDVLSTGEADLHVVATYSNGFRMRIDLLDSYVPGPNEWKVSSYTPYDG